jgi:dTDP-4-dehydrorhamnose reductase
VDGTKHIAKACKEIGAKMIYISTDYVFNGKGEKPFEVYDKKDSINYYGITKSLGEDAVTDILSDFFIVRISWAFGVNGSNFVKTMMRLGKERDFVKVVNDQIGSPTYTADLAGLLTDMVRTNRYGIYHATNEGYCSWYEFASSIMRKAGLNCKVEGITSSEYPTKAVRPMNSRLSKTSLDRGGFMRLGNWDDALRRCIGSL